MKKKRRKKNKGPQFERDFCKKLSLWWTEGKRDDVFWRTSGSGARAKTRSKSGQETFGQYGDVQAIDPIGQPLMDICTIELKRGYNNETLSDFIEGTKRLRLLDFMEQAREDARLKGGYSEWVLVVKRDRKDAILFTPYKFYKDLNSYNRPKMKTIDVFLYNIRFRNDKKAKRILICSLDWFLGTISPKAIKSYHHSIQKVIR